MDNPELGDDMNQKRFIVLEQHEADEYLPLLKIDEQVADTKRDAVIHTWTADFGKNMNGHSIQADIKLCNGDTGPWVDAVLFLDGSEVYVLEPSDSILGEYLFVYEGDDYVVDVKEPEEDSRVPVSAGLTSAAVCFCISMLMLTTGCRYVHPAAHRAKTAASQLDAQKAQTLQLTRIADALERAYPFVDEDKPAQ